MALFNTLAKSPQKEKDPTHNQDTGSLLKALEDLREQIVERIEDSMETKVNTLKQSLTEYINKLEYNSKTTQENKARIINPEDQVTHLKNTTRASNSEIEGLKSSHTEMETRIESYEKEVGELRSEIREHKKNGKPTVSD